MDDKIKEFRDGIFSLKTRRFGKVAELMIKKLYSLDDSDNISYDLKVKNGEKIEVKFSTVLKKCPANINNKNLIKSVIDSNYNNRMLSYEEARKAAFDCNIQQIKRKNFKSLYYGCFFKDKIMICKISKDDILNDEMICYSNYQHEGNVGEGQFHINNSTIDHHLKKYFIKWLTYDELYEMFKEKVTN